ncbi:MAG: hypothetical protein IJZ85_05440 [Lachnospiraceae bacterium]|nr:hypothetical protein [Lachnospiraceae bacterium]
MRLRYGKWTTIEVEAVIGVVGALGYVICGLILGFRSPEAFGIVLGVLGAMVFFYSMAVSMETTLDIGAIDGAKRHTKRMMAVRYSAVVLAVALLSRVDRINVVTGLLALLASLKIAIFAQPMTHRLFCRWFHLSDELSPEALYLPEEDDDREDEEDDDDEDKPDRIDRWMDRLFKK